MANNTQYTLVDTGREEDRPFRETLQPTAIAEPKTKVDADPLYKGMPANQTESRTPELEPKFDMVPPRDLTVPPPSGGIATPAPKEEDKPTGSTGSTGTTTGSTSSSGSITTSATDPAIKKKVTDILNSPTDFLKDNKLQQQYTQQELQANEITDPLKYQVGPTAAAVAQEVAQQEAISAGKVNPQLAEAAPDVKVQDFEAALIDPGSLTKAIDEVAKLDPMKAASMSEHLDGLLKDLETGNVPVWARPAVTKVEQMLAARGISASSIGRDSLFNAIIQAAMPIAQQDATFEQDAAKVNYNAKVQAVLADVNMDFAAKQFNAQSQNQTNQFKAQLRTQVDMQNAARKEAMSQWNAQEANKMGMFNVQNELQTAQFNAQMKQNTGQFNATQVNAMTQLTTQLQAQREQFNSQSASVIEQSNVNWRRQLNTANTAGVNAVNQANVQNAFNLSNQALTFLWQEMRDKAHWEFQASESEKDRKNQLEATLLANEAAMGGEIGRYIEGIAQGSKFLSSFLNSWK